MKIITFILATCSLIALISCSSLMNCTEGSGNIESKSIDLKNIKEIEVNGSGNLLIVDSEENIAKVYTDNNLIDNVSFEQKNGKLIIKIENNICPTKMNILVNTSELESLEISGAFNVLSKEKFVANNFDIEISGSGNVVFQDVDIKNMNIEISGSGDVKAIGKSDKVKIEISGSGDINCENLTTQHFESEIYGSGNISIDVRESLSAKVYGSGDLIYTGNPKSVKQEIYGSGDVRKK